MSTLRSDKFWEGAELCVCVEVLRARRGAAGQRVGLDRRGRPAAGVGDLLQARPPCRKALQARADELGEPDRVPLATVDIPDDRPAPAPSRPRAKLATDAGALVEQTARALLSADAGPSRSVRRHLRHR
jgi:hypothetical protein